tara:strand:- start:2601 stop:2834 length:234 start_codon:yes stop_codon:yes gene_type:complete
MIDSTPLWFKDAPCIGQDRLFFSSHPKDRKEAKLICKNACENINECKQFALEAELTLGVWGGLTGPELARELEVVHG